jgi:hypothetical protein
MKLHNWLFDLIGYFTLGMGGGGGGQQSQQTSQQLDPTVKPFVEYGLNEAKSLYQSDTPSYYPNQTYISPSADTQAALQAAQNRALAGNPLNTAGQQQQLDVINGKYLNSNPYFDQALRGAAQGATTNYYDAVNAANSNASQAGRYGSNAQGNLIGRADTALGNALTNAYGNLAYQNYNNERAAQNQAAVNAPNMANADYTDINKLLNVGQTQEQYQQNALQADINKWNFNQNLPYQKLSAYLGAAYGAPTGTVTNSTSSSGKIVCTAMNKEYGFGSFRQAIWLAQSKDLDPAYEKGYHALFLPLVNYAYKSGEKNALQRILRGVLEHIARHRTADIWKQKRSKKRDGYGMIYRAILEPICFVVGKVA